MMTSMISAAAQTDSDLVGESLSGNRDAFGQIVSRYQSLICSLAYSATGSLGQSEDLAQETFITAWKRLGHLRERDKLRAWLCGIARNRINNFLRREGREPNHHAAPLEEISESHSPEPLPVEKTISNEEAQILWRSLEHIPEIYREPLVLFYREQQSIETVAANLDLSEDAVKQRLSRGRKLLQEQVFAFVEGALKKTSPGKTFALGVVAALPMVSTSAKAATIGSAIAKSGVAAKSFTVIGALGWLGAMLGGAYVSFKAQVDDAKSSRERKFMLQVFGKRTVFNLLMMGVFLLATRLDFFRVPIHLDFLIAAFAFYLCACMVIFFDWHSRRRQQIQIEDNTYVNTDWTMPRKVTDAATDLAGVKTKNKFKTIKFMAFGIVLTAVVIAQQAWEQHWKHAVLVTALFVLLLFRGLLQWQNSPRFISLRAGWFVFFPICVGLLTLFLFDFHQYQVRVASDIPHIALPIEIFTFNFVVILAYAALVGMIIWKRKAVFRSTPPK